MATEEAQEGSMKCHPDLWWNTPPQYSQNEVCTLGDCTQLPVGRCEQCNKPFCRRHLITIVVPLSTVRNARAFYCGDCLPLYLDEEEAQINAHFGDRNREG